MIIDQSKFAKLCGVSRNTIIADIKRKPAVLHVDIKTKGIDPDHALNRAYIEDLARKKKKPESTKKVSEAIQIYGSLEEQKIEQEIKLKIEQRLSIQQKRLTGIGVLILRELVEKRIARLGQALKTHILTTPRKVSPKIYSMVKAGATVAEVEKEIARELEKALGNAKV